MCICLVAATAAAADAVDHDDDDNDNDDWGIFHTAHSARKHHSPNQIINYDLDLGSIKLLGLAMDLTWTMDQLWAPPGGPPLFFQQR